MLLTAPCYYLRIKWIPINNQVNGSNTVQTLKYQRNVLQSACGKKNTVGKMRLIETILNISRLGFSMFRQSPHETDGINFCDLLLETWSTLWNITGQLGCRYSTPRIILHMYPTLYTMEVLCDMNYGSTKVWKLWCEGKDWLSLMGEHADAWQNLA